MASILEALEMAQQRNKERDVMNTERRMPILPIIDTGEVKPIVLDTGGGDGPDVYQQDTRTEQEKYNDLVAGNKYAPMVPVVGTALGLLNDYQIDKMEKANPSLRPEDPFSAKARERFSYAGRVAGYGYPQQEGKYHTSLWDRITGYDPTYAESLARTNYPVPTNTRNYNNDGGDSGGWETSGNSGNNTTNFGGRESSVSYDDYSGYA